MLCSCCFFLESSGHKHIYKIRVCLYNGASRHQTPGIHWDLQEKSSKSIFTFARQGLLWELNRSPEHPFANPQSYVSNKLKKWCLWFKTYHWIKGAQVEGRTKFQGQVDCWPCCFLVHSHIFPSASYILYSFSDYVTRL